MARRLLFGALLLATVGLLTTLLMQALEQGGWTLLKLALLLAFIPVAVWLGICVGNAVPGFIVLVASRRAALAVLPVQDTFDRAPIALRTAIVVTVRNEDMGAVLPPLRLLMAALDDPAHFQAWVLSDTQEPALAEAEATAIAAAGFALSYRRRTNNAGYKAGNVMDFLDHHAAEVELVVMLDADSTMAAAAVRRLVRIMQADPSLGLVQHLTAGRPAAAAFPRLFQFGMRAGMRVWSVGQALWQGRAGPYWGHNAIFRATAFRTHCRLPPLADGSIILSHDQVEAARLSAAGWGVVVWAEDDGSYEANPPAMPEFLHRDRRWLAGNMQYRHLLTAPGFLPMGRWQLVQAMLLFAGAPLYVAIYLMAVGLAAAASAAGPGPATLAVAIAWPLALYAPKLLGYTEILLFPARRAAYGGADRFVVGALIEIVFTLLLDAPAYVSKTLALLRLLLGGQPGWLPQNRSDRGVAWHEALRLFWPHTLLGMMTFSVLLHAGAAYALLALPFAGGLLTVVPFCVLTSGPTVSRWLASRRIAAMPEELTPPAA